MGRLQVTQNFTHRAHNLVNSNYQAVAALNLVRDVLMCPLGVKTLDPEDPDYDGVYLDGSDNYHQGPEWLFPAGKET